MANTSELAVCGVNDHEDEGNEFMTVNKVAKKDRHKICYKCRDINQKLIILFRNEAYCKTCYIDLIRKKFKPNLAKCRDASRPSRESENVVIALSGGTSSNVMLELIYQNTTNAQKSKLFFKGNCVYIDESSIYPNLKKDDIEVYLKKQCNLYGYPLTIIPLENIFGDNPENREHRVKMLKESVESFSSQTSREDISIFYREQLLRKCALELKAKRVIFGTSSVSLATKVFSLASKGRGFTLPNEVSISNQTEVGGDSIIFNQPMKEFILKEIYIYSRNVIGDLPTQFSSWNAPAKQSLNTLCEDFVHTLQDISSQTVYTLLRSADKLVTPTLDNNFYCSLCYCHLSTHDINHINSIKNVKSTNSNNNNNNNNCCSDNSSCSTTSTTNNSCCSTNNNNNQLSNDTLCYSCRILVKENRNPNLVLPKYIYENSKSILTTAQLKNEIKDFLLDDNDD
ncbi:cytosolic thiouridylase subunit 2 [Tieghemostelium lacteum]|uniref:Cytoplasmic tRNA 2-thiolation protein 2 n=1 Tax=Tieghemostelium lacteum TaxID=361077 RepID=A0A151Z6C8_TIELA|nr:cytosolic thiouridylase subunit 2 [Tieghemostelium lacteum]|eukprot:KYQ89510.1 cytosolic thiouridylase subunit 2 [Tieghemostelium lacteum]